MRICIVGGGLAGTILAWRLAQRPEISTIDLLAGADSWRDATQLSGGVVRCYEPQLLQRRLAIESLAELRASDVLRRWSEYCETGSLYLRARDPGLSAALRDVEAAVPGSVRLAAGPELAEFGWAGLPADTVGVVEGCAGFLSPSRWRAAMRTDLHTRGGVAVSSAAMATISTGAHGSVICTAGHQRQEYDVAVLAAGAWTPALLRRNGFEASGFRTKSIQYTVYRVAGPCPPPFVDETTGLYGRPTPDGLLLGLATQEWDVTPESRAPTVELHQEAARLTRTRLRHLTLGSPIAVVNATDCYCDPPVLALRPVPDTGGGVWTFTGGSGGSVKTALAASRQATECLIDPSNRCSFDPFYLAESVK